MDSTESVPFPPYSLAYPVMNNPSLHQAENNQEVFDKGAIKNKPRRKKAARACLHCQKSHLTCSDERPCKRCILRGLQNECTDGQRKKAKYLIEPKETAPTAETKADDPALQSQQNFISPSVSIEAFHISLPTLAQNYGNPQAYIIDPNQEYGFFSETANLEHAILSNMASQYMFQDLGSYQGFPAFPLAETWAPLNPAPPPPALTPLPHSYANFHSVQAEQRTDPVSPLLGKRDLSALRSPEQVSQAYSEVKKAYCYSKGYHYLQKYIQERMSKENVLRICRAISQFRPSFIALFMNLTEEDLVFVEKCFQRTLLEFEKLIGLSGTPTVVWRRSGEIVLVGKEFSILTSWSPAELVGKSTFIYELMDDISAVEYWEKYAVHAFDNSEMSVMSTCNIYGANQKLVHCAFCFTIKRDMFDTPLLIVGNFLPILT